MKTIYGLVERYCNEDIILILADNKYSCVQMLRQEVMGDINASFEDRVEDLIEEGESISDEELRELIREDLWNTYGCGGRYSIEERYLIEEGDEIGDMDYEVDYVDMGLCFDLVYDSMNMVERFREAMERSGVDE